MTIEEIYNSERISIRSFNVCTSNNLNDLISILKHFREYETFSNLRNCGEKSNGELIALCLKYEHNIEHVQTEELPYSVVPILTKRIQRDIVNSFIEINSRNLSNRSINAITSFLHGNLKIKNISEHILNNKKFKIQNIKNIGEKSVTELENFIDSIISFTQKVSSTEDENDLISMKNLFFIEKTFSVSEMPNEVLEIQSIFKLTNFLISQNVLYESNQNIIFKKAIKIYNNQPELTLNEIAEQLNVSKERVRQIRKSCLERLFDNLQFIKNIDDDFFQKCGIEFNQDFISIHESLSDTINDINNTNFTNEFITYLIYVYISDKFNLIGNIEDVLQFKKINSRNRHNWEKLYLVNIEICTEFDFNAFVNDLEYRLGERIEDTYSFNFRSYLLVFLRNNKTRLLSVISIIAEEIINQEFGLFISLDDNIVFNRNTVKHVPEYAINALEKLGIPSKIEDIYNLIESDFPQITRSIDALRGSLQRSSDIINFGRSSTYGLKKWEKEVANIKGGTIRQIVTEFLENYETPKHFSDITSHVLKFRPQTNEYSIIQNLKLDGSEIFIFFKNSLVGLSNKHYDYTYVLLPESIKIDKKSWEERYTDLMTFVERENKLPSSSSCPDEEKGLYRWYKVQVGKVIKRNLDDKKSNLINDIFNQFENNGTSRKRRTSYTEKYHELGQFLLEEHRLPSANKIGEESLYKFFYKQRKLFNEGRLAENEESNFIEITKLIQINENKRY